MEGSLDERNPIMVFGCTACAIGSFVTTLPPAGTMTRRHMSFAFALLWDVIAYGGLKNGQTELDGGLGMSSGNGFFLSSVSVRNASFVSGRIKKWV